MNDTHRPYQRCTNCVMDTSDSAITFDEHGVCDFCNDFYQNIQPSWQDKLKDPDLAAPHGGADQGRLQGA